MKKLTKASTGAVLVALGIVGANPARAATFFFAGTSTGGNLSSQFELLLAALGTTTKEIAISDGRLMAFCGVPL